MHAHADAVHASRRGSLVSRINNARLRLCLPFDYRQSTIGQQHSPVGNFCSNPPPIPRRRCVSRAPAATQNGANQSNTLGSAAATMAAAGPALQQDRQKRTRYTAPLIDHVRHPDFDEADEEGGMLQQTPREALQQRMDPSCREGIIDVEAL